MPSVEDAREWRVGVLIGDESTFDPKKDSSPGVAKNVSEDVGEARWGPLSAPPLPMASPPSTTAPLQTASRSPIASSPSSTGALPPKLSAKSCGSIAKLSVEGTHIGVGSGGPKSSRASAIVVGRGGQRSSRASVKPGMRGGIEGINGDGWEGSMCE